MRSLEIGIAESGVNGYKKIRRKKVEKISKKVLTSAKRCGIIDRLSRGSEAHGH